MAMLDRLLHQKRFPRFTALSILTAAAVWAVWLHEPGNAFLESAGYRVVAVLVFALGLALNIVWGSLAKSRGEYGGVWIANLGIALPAAAGLVWAVVGALLG